MRIIENLKIDENKNIDSLSLKEQIVLECDAMSKYALQNGKPIPPDSVDLLETIGDENYLSTNEDLKNLAILHYKLSKIIDPAKPSTILLLFKEKKQKTAFMFLGGVPLVRRMMFVAILFLLSFVAICTLPIVNEEAIKKGILYDDFFVVLINLTLIIASAGLGASFTALFTANKYIVKGLYDPKYESSYWIRLVLGIMAGLILATLIPIDLGQAAADSGLDSEEVEAFSKLILAMLGGFSSTLLYKILNRLVETIESLINGSPQNTINTSEMVSKAKIAAENSNNLLRINSKLVQLQSQITCELSTDEMKKRIAVIADELMPYEAANTFEKLTAGQDNQNEDKAPAPNNGSTRAGITIDPEPVDRPDEDDSGLFNHEQPANNQSDGEITEQDKSDRSGFDELLDCDGSD